MHSWRKTLLAAAAVCVIGAVPALGLGYNPCKGNSCGGIGAPGPIAGAGLPFLLLAGGYVLARRYRKKKADKE